MRIEKAADILAHACWQSIVKSVKFQAPAAPGNLPLRAAGPCREQRGSIIDIKKIFPFLNWPRPSAGALRRDAWAGISVGLVLVPQAIAYATLAGMPPHTGLYAAMLPAVAGVLWGSSALLAVGPVALTSLLVYGSLMPLAQPGTRLWVDLAIWLSLYAGVIQFLLGAFKLGRIANIVSQPVIVGFINAAALIIILSQVPALLGIDLSLATFRSLADGTFRLPAAAPMTSAFGGASLALLLLFKRFLPRLPGILLVTIGGIAASMAFAYAAHGGQVAGAIPGGLPTFSLPSFISFDSHRELWPAALIVALISFTEAMSSCRVLARKTNEQWNENQELIGQGLAKFISGLNGAFPVSGSFSRSALNLYAGATSAWSTLFAAACVGLSLLFLTDLIYHLPRSVLAAMIIVPVLNLFDFRAMRRLFSVARSEGTIAAVTFAVTLFSMPRLHWGVFAGVGLTMIVYLYRLTTPRIVEVGQHKDGTLRDRSRFDLPPLAPDLLAVRIDAALNFLTAAALERFIVSHLREHRHIRRVLFCAGSVNDIDASGIETLESLKALLATEGVDFSVSAIKKQVWDVLEDAGLIAAIGSDHIYATDREAIARIKTAARIRSAG
jgi:SulP family sulfate permease